MIKRIIGWVFTLAVVVIIAFTAIGAGSYNSMLSVDLFNRGVKSSVEAPIDEPQPEVEKVEPVDSLAGETVESELSAEQETEISSEGEVATE